MPYEARLTRRVEFFETDAAGVVHFSNFFRYMEMVEHVFVRSIKASIAPGEDGLLGWPRVHASCDYRRPLRYDQAFEMQLLVTNKTDKSVHFEVRFWSGADTDPLAQGKIVVVPVARVDGEVKAVALPRRFADAIQIAPLELLATSQRAGKSIGVAD